MKNKQSTFVSDNSSPGLAGLGDRTLRLTQPYMKGKDVAFVQKVVGAEDDGVFGPNTKSAVKQYQRDIGWDVADGSVGPALWERIKDDAGWLANLKNSLDFMNWATEGTEYDPSPRNSDGGGSSKSDSDSSFLDSFDKDFFEWYEDKPPSDSNVPAKTKEKGGGNNTVKYLAWGAVGVTVVGVGLAMIGGNE